MLSETTDRLYAWDWAGAVEEAKGCLRVSRDEVTRDEALNLLAAARWQLGDDDAAFQANEAIDGQHTEGLQVNMGVVAAFVDPQLAAGTPSGAWRAKPPDTDTFACLLPSGRSHFGSPQQIHGRRMKMAKTPSPRRSASRCARWCETTSLSSRSFGSRRR